MTRTEFNEKYKDYLEEGHYGLSMDLPEITNFLDEIFEDLIKIPGFQYSQIKIKFGTTRFYADPITRQMTYLIEGMMDKILKCYEDEQKQRTKNNTPPS